jgi:hypothetical protein
MFKQFRPLRPYQTEISNANAINALAVAQHSDPMHNHARLLGSELRREELERRYEVVCLVLAFSGCVNIGFIIWAIWMVATQQ